MAGHRAKRIEIWASWMSIQSIQDTCKVKFLPVMLGVIRCTDFQKPCASKTAGLIITDTSRSLCYQVLCGHCLPSCQAERQAPGLHVNTMNLIKYMH